MKEYWDQLTPAEQEIALDLFIKQGGKERVREVPNPMEQGGISDRLGNFDDWGNRIRPRD